MNFDIVYKDGKLLSSYCKNVKDGVTEIVTIAWNGTKYVIKKGEEVLQLTSPIHVSAIQLYFNEPLDGTRIFSERMGVFCTGLEMSKGASVFMKLLQ